MIFTLTTRNKVIASRRKMDIIFEHVKHLYRDKVRFKECTETQYKTLIRNAKQQGKTVHEFEGV